MATQAEQSEDMSDVPATTSALPAIAAAFLVAFDDRKGYTLAWQRTVDDSVNIEGVVEFKSMPSGLHNVKQDLVYFVHEEFAGICAVLNIEDLETARKARVIAVGVLVPLEHGRLGKSWLYAEDLQALAKKQIHEKDNYSLMERFWEEHRLSSSPEPLETSDNSKKGELTIDTSFGSISNGYKTTRSMSVATAQTSAGHVLPVHHPARMLPEFLRLFGPLVFPLVRAALLRKRILFLGEAPVERTCDYVYNLSILSSIPKPIVPFLPHLQPAQIRLRPLFNIGASDIPFLESESKSSSGWIACTTDDVLCTKPDLFDVLVILPSILSQSGNLRPYPKIYFSSPELSKARPKYGLRASQRDAKRFANVSKGLQSIPRSRKQHTIVVESSAIESSSESSHEPEAVVDPAETASIISTASSQISLKSVVEPQSWSRIAYTSLVWWASAGDKRSGLTEMEEHENEQDVALLTGDNLDDEFILDQEGTTREVSCVQYFHRWTNMMFTAAGDAIRRQDGSESEYQDEDEGQTSPSTVEGENDGGDNRALLSNRSGENPKDHDEAVEITQEDLQSMGLDVWSQSDRRFVEEMIQFWWGRKTVVQSGRIECCGVRIL